MKKILQQEKHACGTAPRSCYTRTGSRGHPTRGGVKLGLGASRGCIVAAWAVYGPPVAPPLFVSVVFIALAVRSLEDARLLTAHCSPLTASLILRPQAFAKQQGFVLCHCMAIAALSVVAVTLSVCTMLTT